MDSTAEAGVTSHIEEFSYDDATPRAFAVMTVVWGIVGMLVGLLAALELAAPSVSLGLPFLSFGRLRPLHTNAVILPSLGTQSLPPSTIRRSGCAKLECSAAF